VGNHPTREPLVAAGKKYIVVKLVINKRVGFFGECFIILLSFGGSIPLLPTSALLII
jgi:hypothetical protein